MLRVGVDGVVGGILATFVVGRGVGVFGNGVGVRNGDSQGCTGKLLLAVGMVTAGL